MFARDISFMSGIVMNTATIGVKLIDYSLQESLGQVLTAVFKLNIENNVSTVQHIVSSINMLNMQAGNN